MKAIANLINDEKGVTAIEYGLIAGLIVLLCLAAITTAGQSLLQIWTTIATNLTIT